MAEYTSDIKTISSSDENVFAVLSDLRKLDLIKDKIPQDQFKDFSYDQDSCTVNVSPIGNIRFVIVDRKPNSTVKFEAEKLPFKLNLWIQLKQVAENDTEMKLTVDADLNPFLKPMVSKPLQEGLNKMAEALSNIPYNEIITK
ncbi:MAG: SRPBCC family protein [Dysgonomonas sp.]|nr:SRPBCC family protein [Dysgonomonas sp.]